MEDKDLQWFRHHLTQWMEELLEHAENAVEGLLDARENLPDPVDRASADLDRTWALRLRGRESMLIKKISNSLDAIKSKDYGICEDCGEEISIERLKARPVTSLCIGCKSNRESMSLIGSSRIR